MDQENYLGQKRLTPANWHQPDQAWRVFGGPDQYGNHIALTQERWADEVFEPRLNDSAPEEVKALFEVARGAMLYAYFYYPVMTLASEQLYRVTDAALIKRLEGQPNCKDFKGRISMAIKLGIIPSQEEARWDATRELRNYASHPKRQSILAPGNALSALSITARQINLLFPV